MPSLPWFLPAIPLILALWLPCGRAQDAAPSAPPELPPFPNLKLPADTDLATLESFLAKAKKAQPRSPQQYRTMQEAIRDASKKLVQLLEGQEETGRYRQAELDIIAASISLMAFSGEDAQKATLEQVHAFLNSRKQLSLSDIQTGMLAAAMLELQPNKNPARETYELLDRLLTDDPREEMQSLRINLQASVRRLNLLGNKLPLAAQTRDGKPLKIEDYAGKFVIVDFFATWCGPCLTEVPRLKKHYEKYHARGLEVIGVSLDEDTQALEDYLRQADLPWPIIHDNANDPLERLQMQFGVSQLPTVLLLNKEGTVVSLEARGAEQDRLMQMLFEAPTPAPPRAEDGQAAEEAAKKTN